MKRTSIGQNIGWRDSMGYDHTTDPIILRAEKTGLGYWLDGFNRFRDRREAEEQETDVIEEESKKDVKAYIWKMVDGEV